MTLQRFYTTATTYSYVGTLRSDSYSIKLSDYNVSDRSIYFIDGNDTVSLDNSALLSNGYFSRVHLGAGNDTLVFISATLTYRINISSIHGGTGNDNITIGIDVDNVYGGMGVDSIFGGADVDLIYGDEENDFIDGGLGNDILTGGSGSDLVNGGSGDDYLKGDCDDYEEQQLRFCDYLYRYEENEGGIDILYGGDGNDLIVGGSRIDEVHLGSGSDTIGFEDWDELGDEIYDFASDDKIELVNILNDRNWDGVAFDQIISFRQIDTGLQVYVNVDGDGTKKLLVATLIGYQSSSVLESQILFGQCVSRYISGTEIYGTPLSDYIDLLGYSASGAAGDDTIVGNEVENSMYGGIGFDIINGQEGADKLFGGSGDDSIFGGEGNDSLFGGSGSDVLTGGEGDDVYIINSSETTTELASEGNDNVRSSVTYTLGLNVENLVLTGTTAINGTGNTLANSLTGNSTANSLNGVSGADTLIGGGGNDSLSGGSGQDLLTGGSGIDQFVFRTASESSASATSADVITDFVRGTDKISLSVIDAFASGGTANDIFLWRGTAAFSSTTAGEVRYQQFDNAGTTNDYTMVLIDNDADTTVEMSIRVNGLFNFTASDFIL